MPTYTNALLWCAEKFLSWWDLQGSTLCFLRSKSCHALLACLLSEPTEPVWCQL